MRNRGAGHVLGFIIMNANVVLDENPSPSDEEIKKALDQIL